MAVASRLPWDCLFGFCLFGGSRSVYVRLVDLKAGDEEGGRTAKLYEVGERGIHMFGRSPVPFFSSEDRHPHRRSREKVYKSEPGTQSVRAKALSQSPRSTIVVHLSQMVELTL